MYIMLINKKKIFRMNVYGFVIRMGARAPTPTAFLKFGGARAPSAIITGRP